MNRDANLMIMDLTEHQNNSQFAKKLAIPEFHGLVA
jgi:hypothetical protein